MLARRLYWLGGFAICEALNAWNSLLMAITLDNRLLFQSLHPIFAGLSYTFLLAFGIQTLIQEEEPAAIKNLPVWLGMFWLIPYGIGMFTPSLLLPWHFGFM